MTHVLNLSVTTHNQSINFPTVSFCFSSLLAISISLVFKLYPYLMYAQNTLILAKYRRKNWSPRLISYKILKYLLLRYKNMMFFQFLRRILKKNTVDSIYFITKLLCSCLLDYKSYQYLIQFFKYCDKNSFFYHFKC